MAILLNNKSHFGQCSNTNNDFIHDLINNNPRINNEDTVEKLNVDNLIDFCYFKATLVH